MPAERRTFSDPLESIIYWDASFAIGFTWKGDPHHDRAFQLIKDFNLLPTDAYHIAVALEAGVNTY